MSSTSRKRAPLIHRTSNTDTSLSWTFLLKGLSDATEENVITSLLIQVIDTIPSDFPIANLIKLIACKLPFAKFSTDLRKRLKQLLGAISEPLPHAFLVVRYLVKQERSRRLEWDKGAANLSLLLSLEMAAWDSISDGHHNKRLVAVDLANQSSASQYAIPLLIALQGRVPSMNVPFENKRVDGLIKSILLHKNLDQISRTSISSLDVKDRTIVSALLLNVGFWSARLDGDDMLARSLLDIVSDPGLESHKRLLFCQLGSVGLYHSGDYGSRLEKIVSAVQFGDSLKPFGCGQVAENRYEIALLCMLTAAKYESSDVVRSVSHALYGLHCLKFSDIIKSGVEAWHSHIGTEGLLSLFHSDKVPLQSIIPTVPPLQKHFIALECVRLAAGGYERIGYVPGASWLLHRGLAYINVMKEANESIAVRLERYNAMFRSRLKAIHLSSLTAIVDPHMDTVVFQNAKIVNSIRDVSFGVEERLNVLRSIVINQHLLHGRSDLSHIERLELVRLHARTHRLSYTAAQTKSGSIKLLFEISDNDELVLKLILRGNIVLTDTVCGNVTETVTRLLSNQYDLLAKNKELIESAQDSKQFWSERRDLDTAMNELIGKMKESLLPILVVDRLKLLIQSEDNPIVLLSLPDILLGLPIEALLDNLVCVRSVRMNQHGRVVPPVEKHKDLQCSYVINPSGDCVTTQSTILPILVANNWTGRSGTPTFCDKDFSNLLKTSNVFLFSGHGGGEKHWSGLSVQRLYPSSHGIALLMGCSSTKPYGDYNSCFITPFHYLIGGFRAVVGTLWDVLGRELDRMTVHIIQSLKSDNVRNLVYILQDAKRLAKLSNLSSASVVVYVDESLFPN